MTRLTLSLGDRTLSMTASNRNPWLHGQRRCGRQGSRTTRACTHAAHAPQVWECAAVSCGSPTTSRNAGRRMALAAGALSAARVERSPTGCGPWRNGTAAAHLAEAHHGWSQIFLAGGVMAHAQCATTAAGGKGPAFGIHAARYLQAAAVAAEPGPDFARVYVPTEPVMAEAQDATAAAGAEGPARTGDAWCHAPATTDLAEALRHLNVAGAFLELLQPLLPGRTSQLVHGLGPHACLLLIHPRELETVLGTHVLDPALHVGAAVPCVHHQPLHVFAECYLTVDLRLLVLHFPDTAGVSKHGCVCRVGNL
mmetsp:Transcript_69547/g.225028  ORF Transcript_69547/g.225028 Transcript_69547/m.225028 type:complete len:310 (+) Transcript_69547:28-957(+)